MRTILMTAVVLTACVPPRQQTTPELVDLEPLERAERVTTESAIDGLQIEAVPSGAAGFTLRIKNESDQSGSIIWDESTLVASTGESAGRLIRGETRRMDVNNAQPPTPLPANAAIVQLVFAEKMTGAEQNEGEAAQIQQRDGGVLPRIRELMLASRERRRLAMIGGRLNLTIQIAAEKRTWTGVIADSAVGK